MKGKNNNIKINSSVGNQFQQTMYSKTQGREDISDGLLIDHSTYLKPSSVSRLALIPREDRQMI